MSNLRLKIIVLLVACFATNGAFTQSTEKPVKNWFKKNIFNGKNSLTYQNGLFNYFYDENPTFMNLFELENVNRPGDFLGVVLIKTSEISYTRRFKDNSNINIVIGNFFGFFGKNIFVDNSKLPIVTSRQWKFCFVEYNRLLKEKNKFKLYYGAGLRYKNGSETLDVFKSTHSSGFGELVIEEITVRNLGATANINMRYDFGKRFFLYSKIDTQWYFYQAKIMTDDINQLNERYTSREFKASSKFNHTFTIGIGFDF